MTAMNQDRHVAGIPLDTSTNTGRRSNDFQSEWRTLDDKTYERDVSSRELVMFKITSTFHAFDLEEWYGLVSASVSGNAETWSFLLDTAPSAWQQLRYLHPGIACTFNPDTQTMQYRPCLNDKDIHKWLDTSYYVDQEATTTNEVLSKLTRKPSCWLCIAPKANLVILFVHHWHCDARGITYLLGKFLDLCQQMPKNPLQLLEGADLNRLPESADHVGGISRRVPSAQEKLVQSTAEALMSFEGVKGLQVQGSLDAPPSSSRFEQVIFTPEETRVLLEACKTKKIGITAAFQAASCIHTISQAPPEASERMYTAVIRRDLRYLLPEPWRHLKHSADSMMMTSTISRVDPKLGFMEIAKTFSADYAIGFSEDAFWGLDAAVWAHIADMIHSGALTDNSVPYLEILLISIGKINNLVSAHLPKIGSSGLSVDSLVIGCTTYLPGESGMWLYTWNDCINLVVGYNQAYRTQDAITKHWRSVTDIVINHLEI